MHNVQPDNDIYQNYVNSAAGELAKIEDAVQKITADINSLNTQINALEDPNDPNSYVGLKAALDALYQQKWAEQQKEGSKYNDPVLDAKVDAAVKAFTDSATRLNILQNKLIMDNHALYDEATQIQTLINQESSNPNNSLNLGALTLLARHLIQEASNGVVDPSTPNDANNLINEAEQAVQNYQGNVNNMITTMIAYMNDIVRCQQEKDADEADLKVAQHNLIIDCIKLAAATASIFGCFFDGDLVDNVEHDEEEIAADKADMAKMDTEMAADRTAVKGLLGQMAAISTNELGDLISSMVDEVKKILATILGSGGNSEGNMQKAAVALVAILAILQAIVSKVHEQKAQDQQFMSLASTDNFEMATNKSQVSLEEFNDAVQFASTMKVLMDVAEAVLTVASVAAAVVSGGAGAILVAAVFAVFTVISMSTDNKVDIMGEALQKLADKIGNGSTASKVLADVIMAVVVVVVIMAGDKAGGMLMAAKQAGGEAALEAGDEAVQAAAKEAAQEAVVPAAFNGAKEAAVVDANEVAPQEIEEVAAAVEKGLEKDLVAIGGKGAGEAGQNGVGKALDEVAKDAAKNPSLLSKTWSAVRKPVLLTVMNFMMFNGFADSFQAIAEKIKSKKDLENDEIFQILKIIAALIQVVLMVAAGSKAYGGNAEQEAAEANFLQKLLGKMDVQFNPATIAQMTMAMQTVGNLFSMGANLGMVDVNNTKADVDKTLGSTAATMVVYQNILNVIKNTQELDSQQAAAQLQQLSASIQETAQKMAAAENEAARLMTENAV